jgi:hypothetical protein
MEDVDIALQPRKLFKDNPPLRLSDNLAASWCNICCVPAGMREVDWHNPPQRLLVLWLTGEIEFETSDGDVRRLAAGSVVLAEDTTGRDTFPVILPKASSWCTWPLLRADITPRRFDSRGTRYLPASDDVSLYPRNSSECCTTTTLGIFYRDQWRSPEFGLTRRDTGPLLMARGTAWPKSSFCSHAEPRS